MTDERREFDDVSALAAEHALRLLRGDEQRRASTREASDPQFAAEVARWRGRLAALFDEVTPAAPPRHLWGRIEAAITARTAVNDNVADLRRRLNLWRSATAAMTAIAACLALVLVYQPRTVTSPPPPPPAPRAAGTPMVAILGDKNATKVVASWDPAARQLVLAVAGDMPAAPGHAHELWVIPADGKPRSLGTMGAGKQMHMRLADALAMLLRQGATIAISVEPPGGSPTGAPTGPVVASGPLTRA
jgi:anti-sigma-K factor RskA